MARWFALDAERIQQSISQKYHNQRKDLKIKSIPTITRSIRCEKHNEDVDCKPVTDSKVSPGPGTETASLEPHREIVTCFELRSLLVV